MTREKPRERIEPNPGDVRCVLRDARGRFTTNPMDESRSLGRNLRRPAKTATKPGHGDRGDRRR